MADYARIECDGANDEILASPRFPVEAEATSFIAKYVEAWHMISRRKVKGEGGNTSERGKDCQPVPFDEALRRLVNTPPKPKKKSKVSEGTNHGRTGGASGKPR